MRQRTAEGLKDLLEEVVFVGGATATSCLSGRGSIPRAVPKRERPLALHSPHLLRDHHTDHLLANLSAFILSDHPAEVDTASYTLCVPADGMIA